MTNTQIIKMILDTLNNGAFNTEYQNMPCHIGEVNTMTLTNTDDVIFINNLNNTIMLCGSRAIINIKAHKFCDYAIKHHNDDNEYVSNIIDFCVEWLNYRRPDLLKDGELVCDIHGNKIKISYSKNELIKV